jgi:hypothetical protein
MTTPMSVISFYSRFISVVRIRNVTGIQGDVSNLEDLDRLYDTVNGERQNRYSKINCHTV